LSAVVEPHRKSQGRRRRLQPVRLGGSDTPRRALHTLPGQRRETIRGNQQSHGNEIAPDMTEAKFFTQYCGGDVSTRVKQLAAFFNTIVLTGTKPLTTSGIPESVPWRHHRQEGRLQEDGLSRLHRPDAGPSSATATRFAPSSAKASTNAPPPSPVLPRHPQAVGCHPTRRAIETQKLTIYALVRRSPKHLRLPPRI